MANTATVYGVMPSHASDHVGSTQQAPIDNSLNDHTPPEEFIPRGDTTATLTFIDFSKETSTLFRYVETPPAGQPQHNYDTVDKATSIHDIRGHESEYTLDHDAFQVISSVPASSADFHSETSIRDTYYPECEALLLKEIPGATKVFLFDHTIRRSTPNATRGPVKQVHIDQTPSSALQRVHLHLGPEAADYLPPQKRFRIINIWRSINGTVESNPLAFCSSASVPDDDVLPVEHRYPERTGETGGVKPSARQKWCYLSGVREDERILLECFDSAALSHGGSVKGGRAPHTAFEHPATRSDARGRASIEVRALVFGENEVSAASRL